MQDMTSRSSSHAETMQPALMSDLISSYEWSATPLGHVAGWPDSLKAAVRILVTSRFPMWMAWGPELTFLYNDAYARVTLGKKHPWALGKPAREVWHEVWNEVSSRIERALKTGEASWDETLPLFLERSGYPEESYHTLSYSPLVGAGGKIEGILCVVIEDTPRVFGERQLEALTTLAGSLVNANSKREVFAAIERGLADQKDIPFALVYLLQDGDCELTLVARSGIDAAHPAARLQFGAETGCDPWPIGQLIHENQAITVDNLPDFFSDLPTGVWDKPPSQARLVPICRRGQQKPAGVFIAALNPYRQLDSSYAGFLDLAAGQIAAGITNAEAYEAEKSRAEALADLDRMKTAFFSNVSHELRTPLTLILGPVEDALTSEQPPSHGSLEMLHRNALRLLKLVNGILDFVRIEAGRLRANYEPTDLSLLTAQLAAAFRSAVERSGLTLVIDCPPLPEPVYVDREMWEKIVLNLLSNALKSTFEGEIRVAISSDSQKATLTVADTGTGIPESELPHLFERFRRIEGARRRSHEGSGIGLALLQELVEMHGGSLGVKSKCGVGTTFSVSLQFGHEHLSKGNVVNDALTPVVLQGSAEAFVQEALGWLPEQPELNSDFSAAIPGDQGEELPRRGKEARPLILLVDDHADLREYVRSLLAGRFDVVSADDGLTALEEIDRRIPDLVLTDVMMPEVGGFALLAALRQNPATSVVPVIMLSAKADEEALIEGLDLGADDYLTKPFSARELVARVEAQLKLSRLRRESFEQKAALSREIDLARQFAWEVLEHIPDSFAMLDRSYRITYMNAAAFRLVSTQTNRPHIGEDFWDLYPILIGTQLESVIRRVMEERSSEDFEQFFQENANEAWFHFYIHPGPDDGIIIYLRNTTEGRKTEQALRRSEQLAAAGRLAASIAHEINNPLEAVTNLLFLAKTDQGLSETSKDLLEVADKELQRLSHITARSLKFYRQRTAPALTALDEVIDSVVFFHDPSIRLYSTRVERRYRPAPLVMCMPGEIQQVFTNLISNALDALAEKGRLVLAVRPAIDGAGHDGVRVTIADDGIGMDSRMFDRLFHPFVTTKGEAGTGLGLWVSKGILDKHRANISVRSKPGCGTVFRLFFPLNAIASELQPA